jgi:hypothetical protein
LIVDNVFYKYSGAQTLPGKKKFMSQGEMKSLIMDSGISKDITERDIGLCFS